MSATEFEIPGGQAPEDVTDVIEPQEIPEALLTDEERAERQRSADDAKAADEAKKANETQELLGKFKGFMDVLSEAPTRQAPAPVAAPEPLPQQPSAEQIEKWNDQLRELSVTDPLRYAAMMREGAIEEAQRRIFAQAGPMMESAAAGFVDRFKSDKKGDSRFFGQIEPLFDKEMADLDATALLRMTPDQRKTEMTRRWKAAAGDFFENNAKPTAHLPTSGSNGGRSVAPSRGSRPREKELELDDGSKIAIMRRFLQNQRYSTPEAAKKAALEEIARIEYGL